MRGKGDRGEEEKKKTKRKTKEEEDEEDWGKWRRPHTYMAATTALEATGPGQTTPPFPSSFLFLFFSPSYFFPFLFFFPSSFSSLSLFFSFFLTFGRCFALLMFRTRNGRPKSRFEMEPGSTRAWVSPSRLVTRQLLIQWLRVLIRELLMKVKPKNA